MYPIASLYATLSSRPGTQMMMMGQGFGGGREGTAMGHYYGFGGQDDRLMAGGPSRPPSGMSTAAGTR